MAALAEVQPARLQSFVSTCLSMLTSRGSHLKIVIQMQFPVVPERRWLLSHCHIWVLPLRCHPAALGTQTAVSSTASCLFVAGAQLNFWNPGRACVYSQVSTKKASLNLEAEPAQPGISSHWNDEQRADVGTFFQNIDRFLDRMTGTSISNKQIVLLFYHLVLFITFILLMTG